MSRQVQIRSDFVCEIFGVTNPFSFQTLPTCADVIKAYFFHVHSKKQELILANCAADIAVQIENIWKKASIPILSHFRVVDKLKTLYQKYSNLKKPYKERIKTSSAYR